MSPIIVDKENKKREILEAATKVFARKGIPKSNIIDIAREAGIGKGTIYEYFRSKEDIINETFRNFTTKFSTVDLETLSLKKSAIDKLLFVIDGWMNVLIESPDQVKVIVEFWADGARLHDAQRVDELTELYNNYRGFLESILIEGTRSGEIRKMDEKAMASLIAGTLDGITLHWILNSELFNIHSALELYKENMAKILRPD